MPKPSRGDVWMADLDPVRGHEQAGRRPILVVSVDAFNHGAARLAVVLPIMTADKGFRSHVPLAPPEGGLNRPSFIKCEDVRSVSTDRLESRLGTVHDTTMREVEFHLRFLMGL